MRRALLFPLISILLLFSATSHAQQLWTGILSSSRAINWTGAGIPGGIPSGSWAQCATSACNTVTSAGTSATAAQINAAIASAAANTYVLLGAGTYNLRAGISFGGKSNVVLRGQGADSTFLQFTSSSCPAGNYCETIAMEGSLSGPDFEQNVCNWTGSYAQGSTSVTLSSCGSTTPAAGSGSNLTVGTVLVLDQVDEAADPGTIWNCETVPACTWNGPGGYQRQDGTCVNGVCARSQQQTVMVTSVSGSGPYTVGISSPLYMPNWRSSQNPQAWFASASIAQEGLENLSIDSSNVSTQGSTIVIVSCYECWVKGVRSLDAGRSHVAMLIDSHAVIRDSYFFENKTGGSVSYGAEFQDTSDSLVENNIFQQITDSDPSNTGGSEGNVVDYNFDINNVYTSSAGWFMAGFFQHAGGDAFMLWEGNVAGGYTSDNIHGTHHFDTLYRNQFLGDQPICDGVACSAQTVPIQPYAGSRYMNIVGNVLGRPSYHNNYQCSATSTAQCSAGNTSIYTMGYTGNGGQEDSGTAEQWCTSPSCGSRGDWDPLVNTYMMRWGNYDSVTGLRFCGSSSATPTYWSSPCSSTSEVPSTLASYSSSIPTLGDTADGQSAMPASFLYSSKPSWWSSSKPWPGIGPDVSSGNIGICSGGTNSGALATSSSECTGGTFVTYNAGHSNSNPAMDCYLSTMGGPPSGTESALTFNAGSCYGSNPPPPAPPTGLTAVVH